ncbi:MAG: hypothetical protein V3V88_00425 [Dehalococcoidia bacterium]
MKSLKYYFKRIKLYWKNPASLIKLQKGSILVATHKGDVNYARYVRFKQTAPQFWEKMDSPLFAVYLEKYQDQHNQSNWAQAHAVLKDYEFAISQLQQDHDAWGLCFALISYEKGEEMSFIPNDVELKDKLDRMTKAGLMPDQIEEGVINFMKTSPGTFQDHLILFDLQNTMNETT